MMSTARVSDDVQFAPRPLPELVGALAARWIAGPLPGEDFIAWRNDVLREARALEGRYGTGAHGNELVRALDILDRIGDR